LKNFHWLSVEKIGKKGVGHLGLSTLFAYSLSNGKAIKSVVQLQIHQILDNFQFLILHYFENLYRKIGPPMIFIVTLITHFMNFVCYFCVSEKKEVKIKYYVKNVLLSMSGDSQK
jgi:hypothetical protein